MTAQQVLSWLDMKQGTAKKSDILCVWHAFPLPLCHVRAEPHSGLAKLGLQVGEYYTLERALEAIGCQKV